MNISVALTTWSRMGLSTGMALLLSLSLALAPAAAQGSEEYKLKAAFVLNFLKFTLFSARTERSTYLVCVDGDTPALEAIRGIDGETAGQRLVSVARTVDIIDLKQCDVRFVPASVSGIQQTVSAAVDKRSLTIVESQSPCEGPWHINLFIDGENRLRFEINAKNASQSGIAFSSKLLSLAKICGG